MSFVKDCASSLPSLLRVWAVASVTLTQLVRMRLFIVLAFFFVGFLALQFLPFHGHMGVEFAGVQQLSLLKDIGSGCMYLFGALFAVAATALLIPRDTEDRIIYTILCKPVPRFDYLLGKALGVLALLLLMGLFMDGLMCLALYLREQTLTQSLTEALSQQAYTPEQIAPYLAQLHEAGATWELQRSLVPMALSCVVLTSMTLLLSCVTSGTLVSMILAMGFFFVGLFQSQFFLALAASTGAMGMSPLMQNMGDVCAVLIPNFSLFAVSDAAIAAGGISWPALASMAGIAFAYFFFHLLLASYLFSRKEF